MSDAAVSRDDLVDDDALAALVRDHHDRVYRFGRAVCRSGADVDEAES